MSLRIMVIILSIIVFAASAISANSPKTSLHQVKFFDWDSFTQGVLKAKKSINQPTCHMYGGIVPHHLFVSFIIADFFGRLSFQKPETIILIGPNHFERGIFKALSSNYSWETFYGTLEPDLGIINELLEKNLIKIDEEVLPEDHSLVGLMPFIKYYLPQAKIVPILIKRGLTQEESRVLSDILSKFVSEGAVIVASLDFSHYLKSAEAKKNDELTLKVLKDFDYRVIYKLNNDYLDSPPSLGTLLMVMEKAGSRDMDILYHTNSGVILKNPEIETTSYFSIFFKK